jgi:hypothetical protein
VLPYALAGDPDRLTHFRRETKILAALNHPDSAVIYGVMESSGAKPAGTKKSVQMYNYSPSMQNGNTVELDVE